MPNKVRRSSAGDTPIMMPDSRPLRQKRSRWGLILIGVLLLAGIAGGAYVFLTGSPGSAGAAAGTQGGGGRRHR